MNPVKIIPVLCYAGTLSILTVCGPPRSNFTADDEAQIRTILRDAPAQLRAKNANAWTAYYAEDAVLQPALEPPIRGRRKLAAWAEALPVLEQVSFSNIEVRGDEEYAYATTDYVTKPAGMPPHSGKQLIVFQRVEGSSWHIVAASMSANAPLTGPVPD